MSDHMSLPLVIAAEQFARLPGIGMKTAQRLAYHILTMEEEEVRAFSDAMVRAREAVRQCKVCQNFTEAETCSVCGDARRDSKTICVVEAPKDVSALERAGGFTGVYHVLHGLLSPMDGIGPEEIRIRELMSRLGSEITEVIMATSPTVEGEATASYIGRMVKTVGSAIRVTRLAYGLPVGGSLEYADDVTLMKALENRNEF